MDYEQFVEAYTYQNKMYNDLRVDRNSLDKVESYKRYRKVLNRSLRIAKSPLLSQGIS